MYEHQDGSKSLKLGDFGLATIVDGPLYTVCGTPTYVAPEIIAETGYMLLLCLSAVLAKELASFKNRKNSSAVPYPDIISYQVSFTLFKIYFIL